MSQTIANLDTIQLQSRIVAEPELLLLDVREPWEYAQGHIAGAHLIPLGELVNMDLGDVNSNQAIVCVCAHGVRSAHAARYLVSLGYENVAHLEGGMAEWVGASESGLPGEP